MAYTILVNDDNTLYGSKKERIMQRSKLMDNLVFIVNPIYKNTYDMTSASVVLEYVLPVSREYKTINLVLSKERYNDCFLQYKLPFDTDLTSQAGSLELQLTFVYTKMKPNGTCVQRVRKTSATTIEIIPITAWSDIVPDSALSAIDQRIVVLDAQMRGLDDYLNVIDNNRVDNLVYNDRDETLQLSSRGIGVGNKVSVKDMIYDGIPVVDLDSDLDVDSDKNNNGCNCGCEHDVVEFGDAAETEKPLENDDNVVEF